MKTKLLIFILLSAAGASHGQGRDRSADDLAIRQLIGYYTEARENKDTVLIKRILTEDIDQLVSTGEWRTGIRVAIEGMMRSSNANPGTRTLTVDKIRYLTGQSALADCRYEIRNPDGSERKMWSSFAVLKEDERWKIAAIRNMLPAE